MAIPFLTKIFGSRNDRLLKTYRKTLERINALEAGLESLSDDELRAKPRASATALPQARVWTPCYLGLLRWCARAPSGS